MAYRYPSIYPCASSVKTCSVNRRGPTGPTGPSGSLSGNLPFFTIDPGLEVTDPFGLFAQGYSYTGAYSAQYIKSDLGPISVVRVVALKSYQTIGGNVIQTTSDASDVLAFNPLIGTEIRFNLFYQNSLYDQITNTTRIELFFPNRDQPGTSIQQNNGLLTQGLGPVTTDCSFIVYYQNITLI